MASKSKEGYKQRLTQILEKYELDGGFLHSTYERGIEQENFNCCYVDDRVKGGRNLRKDLAGLLDDYFVDYPQAVKPLYSYK